MPKIGCYSDKLVTFGGENLNEHGWYLQFLLIAGIIVIGVVKQFKKEAKKNAENRPAMPVPENDIDEGALPIPEARNTYGGFIPEGPAPQIPSVPTAKEEYHLCFKTYFWRRFYKYISQAYHNSSETEDFSSSVHSAKT